MLTDQYAMSNIKLQEATVDESILVTTRILRTRFADNGNMLDLANYIRYETRIGTTLSSRSWSDLKEKQLD